jgi:hypothetical protein
MAQTFSDALKAVAPTPDAPIGAPKPTVKKPLVAAAQKAADVSSNIVQSYEDKSPLPTFERAPLTPPTPPEPRFKNSDDIFSQMVPMLAIWGSLATRKPLVTAMTAFTAAQKAKQEGDAQAHKEQSDYAKQSLEYAMAVNKQNHEEYQEMLDSRKLNYQEKDSELKALAEKNRDAVLLEAIRTRGLDGAEDVMNKRKNASDHIGTGISEAAYQSFKQDPVNVMHAKARFEGMTPQAILGLRAGNELSKQTRMLDKLTMELYPEYDPAKSSIELKADTARATQFARTNAAQSAKIDAASNALDKAIPLAEQAMTSVDLTQYPSLNALQNRARQEGGKGNVAALNTAINAVASDYAAVIGRGNPQITDAVRTQALETINRNMSPEAMKAVFSMMRQETQNLKESIAQTSKEGIMGGTDTKSSSGWSVEKVK